MKSIGLVVGCKDGIIPVSEAEHGALFKRREGLLCRAVHVACVPFDICIIKSYGGIALTYQYTVLAGVVVVFHEHDCASHFFFGCACAIEINVEIHHGEVFALKPSVFEVFAVGWTERDQSGWIGLHFSSPRTVGLVACETGCIFAFKNLHLHME